MKAGKYILRAVKYYVYIMLLLVLMLAVLIALHVIDSDIEKIFRNGYDSLWQIALMFLAMAAIYPTFGYTKKTASATGSLAERKDAIVAFMNEKKYVLSSETAEELKFHRTNLLQRITRTFEDTVTITQDFGGFQFEGVRKDVIGLAYGLETALLEKKED